MPPPLARTGKVFVVDPTADGQWIASISVDQTIQLWPMPNIDEPPMQMLRREEVPANLCDSSVPLQE